MYNYVYYSYIHIDLAVHKIVGVKFGCNMQPKLYIWE